MWITESLWFEIAIVSIIYALGNILMGHFEEQTPKIRRVAKYLLTLIIICGVSVSFGREVSMIFLSTLIVPLIYVHGYFLPKKKGINGWTGEPKSKYYEFRKWDKDVFSDNKTYRMNLNQITVPSLDLTSAIPFYKILGLKLIVESLPHYARFQCIDGNSTFSIRQVAQLPTGDGIHIYFECENLDDCIKELISKGLEIEEMPNNKSWLWREARVKDPDNNQLIFYYAGDNRLNPPWKIKWQK